MRTARSLSRRGTSTATKPDTEGPVRRIVLKEGARVHAWGPLAGLVQVTMGAGVGSESRPDQLQMLQAFGNNQREGPIRGGRTPEAGCL
jgi:hypothetical protein